MRPLCLAAFGALVAGCATLLGEGPCRSEGHETACFERHEDEYLGLWGLDPAAGLAASGVEIRRAMIRDDYARFLPSVEFRRRPGEAPTVTVRPAGPPPRTPAMRAMIGAQQWAEATDAARDFDRLPPPPTIRVEGDEITVCAHSWLIFAEATDAAAQPGLRVRRRVEHSCFGSAAAAYAERLGEIAVRALPSCAAVEIERHPFQILAVCSRFTGNLIAAAAGYNGYYRLASLDEDEAEQARALFAPGATLAWHGFPDAATGAADLWMERKLGQTGGSLFLDQVRGDSEDRASIGARMRRWSDDPPRGDGVWLEAPVEMLWTRRGTRPFRVERIAVGPFAPLPGLCPPGLLTGAERANNCHR
ncbi:MAG TPA: hypothetical protein VF702_12150 [Allosphingosinicella sp.]|jgi:hypothetical protein